MSLSKSFMVVVSCLVVLAAQAAAQDAAPGRPGPAAAAAVGAAQPALVPWPTSVNPGAPGEAGVLAVSGETRIVPASGDLAPLAGVLAEEIAEAFGLKLQAEQGPARAGDIVLRISDGLKGEAYTVRVAEQATVEGGNYAAVALGTTTLLQLLRAGGPQGAVLPRAAIADEPGSAYRGLLIDVARRYHSIDTLRQCVRLCRLYKVRYLQLHLTDDPAFTFPSTAYPKLSSQNHHGGPAYTLAELRGLERYAAQRGVAIVPELEVPGHAGAMNRAMPELFKIKGTKPYEHHATINFANAEVLQAVETLVGEVCDVFRTSPYFHIGGDEADFAFAHQHADFQAAFKRYGLGAKGQWQLYRHFLIQMDQIVRKQGKRMIVWEGFHRDYKSQFQIPKDVIVMEYECPFYPPEQLVADGYTVINASWTPLYVVNRKRWTPQQIHGWNLWLFGQHTTNYATTAWHRLKPTPQIIGAQMCAWEQGEAMEVSSLRRRLPAMAERIWSPAAERPYADFARRAAATDDLLSRLVPTVRFSAEGLAEPDPSRWDVPQFHETLKLTMASQLPAAEIRYTLDGSMPFGSRAEAQTREAQAKPRRGKCQTYTTPVTLDKTTGVCAASYDAAGKPVGHTTAETYYFQKKPEPNLATGKPVSVSGGTQVPQNPEFAVDGKVADPHDSWWAGPAPQWLQVDLQKPYLVDRVKVYPYWDGDRYYQYTVEASLDAKAWTRIVDQTKNTKPARAGGDEFRFAALRARYVRVNLLKNSANPSVHLVELMVFEAK